MEVGRSSSRGMGFDVRPLLVMNLKMLRKGITEAGRKDEEERKGGFLMRVTSFIDWRRRGRIPWRREAFQEGPDEEEGWSKSFQAEDYQYEKREKNRGRGRGVCILLPGRMEKDGKRGGIRGGTRGNAQSPTAGHG